MFLPETYPAQPGDLIFWDFAPVRLPIFTKGYPPHAKGDQIKAHKIEDLDLYPVIYERPGATGLEHELLMFFDADEYSVKDYGLIHGCDTFREHVGMTLSEVFPEDRFGLPDYNSVREQGWDFVSLEFPHTRAEGFSRELRRNVGHFADVASGADVLEMKLISPRTASQYHRALDPQLSPAERAEPPRGLPMGMGTLHH